MPNKFVERLMRQDANIVRFLMQIMEKHLDETHRAIQVENFTYNDYLKAKKWYLNSVDVSATNTFNQDASDNNAFQANPYAVNDVLNTQAIFDARQNGGNGRIVALNLANANRPLGAATLSRHGTQEEYFAHNSSLFLDIYSGLKDESARDKIMSIYFNLFFGSDGKLKETDNITTKEWAEAHAAIRRICKKANYSLHGATAFLHKNVIFFKTEKRKIDRKEYHNIPRELPTRQNVQETLVLADVVSVAALNLNLLTHDPDISHIVVSSRETQRKKTSEKVEQCLTVAAHKKSNFLILGALGCGAFRNPPEMVAGVFTDAIRRLEVKAPVLFAIFGQDEYSEHNRKVFKEAGDNEAKFSQVLSSLKDLVAQVKGDNSALTDLINHFEETYESSQAEKHTQHLTIVKDAVEAAVGGNSGEAKKSEALSNLEKLAKELLNTPNYKVRGALMMAAGAALLLVGVLSITAGIMFVPTGIGSALGIGAIAGGSAAALVGVGLFSRGAHLTKEKYIELTNKNRTLGTELDDLHSSLTTPSPSQSN